MYVWVPETRRVCVMSTVGVPFGVCDRGAGSSKLTRPRFAGRLSGGSGCLAVLVHESAAGGVSSNRLAGPILDAAAIVGGALVEAAMGPVGVVVLDVLAQEMFQLTAVPDEGAVEELPANGADPSFRVRVGDGRVGRGANDRGAVASEDLVERGDELHRRGSGTGSSAGSAS
jgi:hypothetical protein